MWIGSSHDRLDHGVTLDRRSASAGSGHGVYALCGEQLIPLPMLSGPCPALSIVALSALAAATFVLVRIVDKAGPAPLDSCLHEARDLVSVLIRRR